MFCLVVLWDVITQCRLISEALVAGIAAERPVSHVAAHVTLEVRQLRERLAAAHMLANVRLESRMCPLMLLQVTQLSKSSLACLTTTYTNKLLLLTMNF